MYFITCSEFKSSNVSCMLQRSLLDGNDIKIIMNNMPISGSLRLGMFNQIFIYIHKSSSVMVCSIRVHVMY